MNITADPNPNLDDEIDLAEYGRVIWRWRVLTVGLTFVLLALAVCAGFLMKPSYIAEVTLLPDEKNSQSGFGSMTDLASRFGFAVPAAGDPTAVFEDILQSRSFLGQYATASLPSLKTPLGATVPAFLGIGTKDKDSLVLAVASTLKAMLKYERKDNVSILSISSPDPLFSASLANDAAQRLQKYNKEGWVTKIQKNRIFVEERMSEIEKELKTARERLSAFRERNMRLDVSRAPDLLDQQEWLMQEVRAKQEVYYVLKKEYEMTRIEEEKDRPYIQVLDPAIPPGPTYKPGRKLLVSVTLVLSLFLGIFLSFITEFVTRNQLLPKRAQQIIARIRR